MLKNEKEDVREGTRAGKAIYLILIFTCHVIALINYLISASFILYYVFMG